MLMQWGIGRVARARGSEHQGARGLPDKRSTEHTPRQRRVGRVACLPSCREPARSALTAEQVMP